MMRIKSCIYDIFEERSTWAGRLLVREQPGGSSMVKLRRGASAVHAHVWCLQREWTADCRWEMANRMSTP